MKQILIVTISLFAFSGCDKTSPDPHAAIRERCVTILREGLSHIEEQDNFWPAIHAAEGLTLGRQGDFTIAALEPLLANEKDDQKRCGIGRELLRAGVAAGEEVMAEVLRSEDTYGHTHAAESLFKLNALGDEAAMRNAMNQDEDAKRKLMAAAALAKVKNDEAAFAILRDHLTSEDPDELRIAAWVLARIGNESDIPALRESLSRPGLDSIVTAYINHALATLGDKEGMIELEKNLDSEDPAIRTYAATFAGDADAKHLLDKLIEQLDDTHLDARLRAAQSILVLTN